MNSLTVPRTKYRLQHPVTHVNYVVETIGLKIVINVLLHLNLAQYQIQFQDQHLNQGLLLLKLDLEQYVRSVADPMLVQTVLTSDSTTVLVHVYTVAVLLIYQINVQLYA